MKLAVMQPYLFPYVGYFQLISSVDAFVVYDDVNFVKGGWINRNYILFKDDKQLITLPLQGASQNKLINQIEVGGQHKILKSLLHNYGKAPYFDTVYPIIEDIFVQKEKNLVCFLDYQLRRICDYLGLHPQWHLSSGLDKDNELCGQDKILAICKELGARHYINAPGGKAMYDQQLFSAHGLRLSFIHPRAVAYPQFGKEFVPNLSIIDVMMFNSQEECMALIEEYDFL